MCVGDERLVAAMYCLSRLLRGGGTTAILPSAMLLSPPLSTKNEKPESLSLRRLDREFLSRRSSRVAYPPLRAFPKYGGKQTAWQWLQLHSKPMPAEASGPVCGLPCFCKWFWTWICLVSSFDYISAIFHVVPCAEHLPLFPPACPF